MTRLIPNQSPEELQEAMEDARIQFERWRQIRKCSTPRRWTRLDEERLDDPRREEGK